MSPLSVVVHFEWPGRPVPRPLLPRPLPEVQPGIWLGQNSSLGTSPNRTRQEINAS